MATYVFQRTIILLRKNLGKTTFDVIFIPAPINAYEHKASSYPELFVKGKTVVSENFFPLLSDYVCKSIEKIAIDNDMGFVDTRKSLKSEGAHQPLHGPYDRTHFNKAGYTALGEILANIIHSANHVQKCSSTKQDGTPVTGNDLQNEIIFEGGD